MNENQVRLANMKKEVTSPGKQCEACHQEFNWWDLLWDIDDDRQVCVNCYNAHHESRQAK